MVNRLSVALLVTLLTGCAANQVYSDASNAQERKTYIACAVTRAFLDVNHDAAPEEVARKAMHRCDGERQAVMFKLIEENADKPFGMKFVEAYMNELHATMRDHIALRIIQSRTYWQRGASTGA